MNVLIESVGIHLPTQVVRSDDLFEEVQLERNYGIPNTWMSKIMGIKERRLSESSVKPSDLASKAAEKALASSAVLPDEIDMLIFCGIEKDQSEPATAHNVQKNLGLNARHVFDTTNACFGFMDGIEIADSFIPCGRAKSALVVTGETQGKLTSSILRQLSNGTNRKNARNLLGFLSLGDAVVLSQDNSETAKGFQFFSEPG